MKVLRASTASPRVNGLARRQNGYKRQIWAGDNGFRDEVQSDVLIDEWVKMQERQNPDLFITLTYDKSPRTPEEAIKNVRKFMEKLRKAPTMKGRHYMYLHVADLQPMSGEKMHHHLVVFLGKNKKPFSVVAINNWIWANWKTWQEVKRDQQLMSHTPVVLLRKNQGADRRRKVGKSEQRIMQVTEHKLLSAGLVEAEPFDKTKGGIGYNLRKHQYYQLECCCPCRKGAPHYCRENGACQYNWCLHQ